MASRGRPKGLPKTGGRKKGVKNPATVQLCAMIDGALLAVGGQKYLEEQAMLNPTAFLTLVGKRIPKDLNINTPTEINVFIKQPGHFD